MSLNVVVVVVYWLGNCSVAVVSVVGVRLRTSIVEEDQLFRGDTPHIVRTSPPWRARARAR